MTAVGRLIHADWSVDPRKRWAAFATRNASGAYCIDHLRRFDKSPDQLIAEGGEFGVLIGFNFPIGLPRVYAESLGVTRFPDFLVRLSHDPLFVDFARPAAVAADISAYRPFFPARPGGTSRAQLVSAHGVASFDDLMRGCERKTPDRPAACSVFWTLGGNQVGRAAAAGWREVLAPLATHPATRFWPFDGHLAELTQEKRVTVVETYPAEAMRFLGVSDGRRFSKRRQADRRNVADRIFAAAAALDLTFSIGADAAVEDGFGSDAEGEDRFDALVGLIGMAAVLQGRRADGAPSTPDQRMVEGWIVGQINEAA